MSNTPTPRTDEFARAECCDLEHALDFARRLERELADALEQVAILRSDEKRLVEFAKVYRLRADEAERELAELTEALAEKDQLAIDMRNQRNRAITARDAERALADRLASELESWAGIAGDYTPMDADEALAAWKEARRGTC